MDIRNNVNHCDLLHRPQQGPSHILEPVPTTGAIQLRRFQYFSVDVLDPRAKKHHVEPNRVPAEHQQHRRIGPAGRSQNAVLQLRPTQRLSNSEPRIEQKRPHDSDNNDGNHLRKQHDRLNSPRQPRRLSQRMSNRHAKPNQQQPAANQEQ